MKRPAPPLLPFLLLPFFLVIAFADEAPPTANAFVSVLGFGAPVMRSGGRNFAVEAGEGRVEVELRTQPGWRLLTSPRVYVSRGETPHYRVVSDDGEQTGEGDIFDREIIRETSHTDVPDGHVSLDGLRTIFVSATNGIATNVGFTASFVLDKPGLHDLEETTIDYRNGIEIGRTVEFGEEEIEPDYWEWTWDCGPWHGTTNAESLVVSGLALPFGAHPVSVSVRACSSACDECSVARAATTNILVWTIVTETDVSIPTNKSRRRIGVGEGVKLRIVPEGIGPATWSRSGSGSLCAKECNPVHFTAGGAPSSAVVSASLPGGSSGSVDFEIVAPDSVVFEYVSHSSETNPLQIEIALDVHVGPSDVNFSEVLFGESTCIGRGTGYFSYEDGEVHVATSSPAPPTGYDGAAGWKMAGGDRIHGMTRGPRYTAGVFHWSVPWLYSRSGVSAEFATAQHDKTLSVSEGTATLRLEKGGIGRSVSASER